MFSRQEGVNPSIDILAPRKGKMPPRTAKFGVAHALFLFFSPGIGHCLKRQCSPKMSFHKNYTPEQ
jgi:hypothetical protein